MTTTTRQAGNPQIEEWIRSHGATFVLKDITLLEVNDRRSLRNQARFQSLDETLVVTYAEAMQEGAEFPPIVVTKDETPGGYLIIDGNHRYAAAGLAGKTHIWAYVTEDLTAAQVSVMTFDANTKHGKPSSAEERKQHAIYLVDTGGINQKEAARMLNVPLKDLQVEMARVRGEKRLVALNVPRWENIARGSRPRLDAIQDDAVFVEAAKLVIDTKIGHNAMSDIVTEINKTHSREDGLAIVAAERERRLSEIKMTVGGRVKIPTNVNRLLRSLTYAENIDDLKVFAGLDTTAKNKLRERMAKVTNKYLNIIEKMG